VWVVIGEGKDLIEELTMSLAINKERKRNKMLMDDEDKEGEEGNGSTLGILRLTLKGVKVITQLTLKKYFFVMWDQKEIFFVTYY